MPKRRALSDSDCGDDFQPSLDADLGDESEFEATHSPKRRKLRTSAISTTRNKAPSSAKAVVHHSRGTHLITEPQNICVALLEWYATVYQTRGMPWRKQYDGTLGKAERSQRAYEVWVSEIMLQQTQVATVIPYYNKWMEKFMTVRELVGLLHQHCLEVKLTSIMAAASVDEVNAIWKGLGYYSRASRLLTGAQKVVREYGGILPDNAKDLEAHIPGIGRYSAGAISSIAYGERVPVLDGNVHRLLSRMLALHAPPKSKATLDILWNAAGDLVKQTPNQTGSDSSNAANPIVKAQHAGDINQALIELGSTVCKVRDPTCESCPLRRWCAAYSCSNVALGDHILPDIEDACTLCEPLEDNPSVTSFPMKAEKKKAREELDVVNVVEWHGTGQDNTRHFLLVKRPEGGLLAGLLEFPTVENVSKIVSAGELSKLPHSQLSQMFSRTIHPDDSDPRPSSLPAGELRITSIRTAGDVSHVFSHIKKTYRIQWIVLEGGDEPPEPCNPPAQTKPSNRTIKSKKRAKDLLAVDSIPPTAQWVPMEHVAQSNIGTGVVKVWKKVKLLWEKT